jgi:hypothetical protein
MNINVPKYRRSIATLFLTGYLFFTAVTIFHLHHVNLLLRSALFSESGASSPIDSFDKLIDTTNGCIIAQISSTILNFSFFDSINAFRIRDFQEFKLLKTKSIYVAENHSNNPLRAPPSNV